MEKTNAGQENLTQEVRKPYQAPQLVNLGEIQSVVQMVSGPGPDAPMCATGAS